MKKETIIIFSLFSLILLLTFFRKPIKTGMSKLTRGYKNNNPGNIVKTGSFWKGEIQGTDSRFKTFINMEYGYRAIFIVLESYINKGFNTLAKIINRYAPPHENITSAYVNTVSKKTGIPINQKIDLNDSESIKKIVAAISFVENGKPGDIEQIESGYKLFKTV